LVSAAPVPSRSCVSDALKFILSQRSNPALLAVTRSISASRSCLAASRHKASPRSWTPTPGTQSADFQEMKTPSSESRSPSLRAENSPICRRAKKNPATTTTKAITTKPSKIHKPRRRVGGLRCGRRLLILCLYYQPCATGPSDQCGGPERRASTESLGVRAVETGVNGARRFPRRPSRRDAQGRNGSSLHRTDRRTAHRLVARREQRNFIV